MAQWPTLEVSLGDGRGEVEIDHQAEPGPTRGAARWPSARTAIRPTAVGKRNWLFMGEAGAGQRGAILYTVVESCRRRGLDPSAYLKDVLARLPQMTHHQIPEILPAAWAKSRPRQRLAS